MIVSHKHKFILIHTRKTAGSSLKVLLAPILGDKDLVIGCADDILRSGTTLPKATTAPLKSLKSQLFLKVATVRRIPKPTRVNRALNAAYREALGGNPAHPTYAMAKSFVGDVWEEYRKICFVRNPFERTVSDYLWRKRVTKKDFSFDDFLDRLIVGDESDGIIHRTAVRNWDMITIDNKLAVDEVGRFESFRSEVSRIFSEFGFAYPEKGASAKKTNSAKSYGEYYNSERIDRVTELFSSEISVFDYRYPY